jgi:hypothetical protein
VGGKRHASPTLTQKRHPVSFVKESGWAPRRIWTDAKTLIPPGFDPQTVQAVASHYTDYAIKLTKILSARNVTRSKFHTEKSQIFGATAEITYATFFYMISDRWIRMTEASLPYLTYSAKLWKVWNRIAGDWIRDHVNKLLPTRSQLSLLKIISFVVPKIPLLHK